MSEQPTKVCAGPAHPQPTRLPLTDAYWYFNRSGPHAGLPQRCKLCAAWKRYERYGVHALVPVRSLRPWLVELRDRCGSAFEVERRYGIWASTVTQILNRDEAGRVQVRTAQRVLIALGEQRKLDRRNGTSARFLAARKAQALSELRMSQLTGY